MAAITVTKATRNLYQLIDEVAESHQPLIIAGKRNNTVLVSEEDWSATQETLFLISTPNIGEGMDTSVSECFEKLDW
ncbi:type II toxin-antitoxin system Phd/YefM family antitoxin [Marinomonas sp.]|uniref:type II toxin-antitoxin system Phd/YefM family antitoxin n=1 Tax=Marinomonas sp. TaxID=1904862 RepID=UPI003BAD8C68